MAVATLTEYAALGAYGAVQAGDEPAITAQVLTTSGSAASFAAFNANTRFISLHTPAAQAIAGQFGVSAATATTTSPRYPANSVLFFGVRPGGVLSVIDVT